MQKRQKYNYGLEFSEGTVSLVEIQDETRFVFVDKAQVDAPEFATKMKSFHQKLTAQAGEMIALPIFLRRLNTPVITAHIDPEGDRDIQIEARLVQHSEKPIAELQFVEGEEQDDKVKLIYVDQDLLEEAKNFLESFNFTPAFFAPRKRVTGFDAPVRFELDHRPNRNLAMISGLGIAAALLLGAFFLWPNAQTPSDPVVEQPIAQVTETPEPEPVLVQTNPVDPIITPVEFGPAEQASNWVIGDALEIETTSLSLSAPKWPTNVQSEPLLHLTGILGEPPKYLSRTLVTASDTQQSKQESTASITDSIAEDVEAEPTADTSVEIDVARTEEPEQTEIEALITEEIADAPRDGTLGNRPLLRPANLKAIEPEVEDPNPAEDAIANDILEQAIASDEDAQQFEGATKFAALVSARPPKKTTRWTTNLALVLESKRNAAARVVTESADNPETQTAAAATDDADARRVSNTYRKNQLSLIGVVGAPSSRRAIFRTASGSIRTIKQGQKVAGWQLVAIGESTVKVVRQGREKTMRLP